MKESKKTPNASKSSSQQKAFFLRHKKFSIIIAVLLLVICSAIPHFTISNGLDSFSGEERKFAETAYRVADGPFIFARKVTSVKRYTEIPETDELVASPDGKNYVAWVKKYTFFGLPFGAIHLEENPNGSGGMGTYRQEVRELFLVLILLIPSIAVWGFVSGSKKKRLVYSILASIGTVVTLFSLYISILAVSHYFAQKNSPVTIVSSENYWLLLHRKSNKEFLYQGVPGDTQRSKLIKTFIVKTGIPGERPTPLPQLLGKKYWVITEEHKEADNPETAPYFLTLNIPAPTGEPFGPSPYMECNGPASQQGEPASQRGEQCRWVLPGAFGLHGTAGNPDKLSADDPGSSGCIRHLDEDITYLYNTLDPITSEIRYYIEDI